MTVGPIRTLIADDEPLARVRVRALLAGYPDFLLVAECADGNEALAAIRSTRPDVVFLDVQMSGPDGITVAAQLGITPMPLVVFVTAYEGYALDAFAVRAVDYLLKPFDEDRFARTVEHLRERLRGATGPTATHPTVRDRILRVADIEIDLEARHVRRNGQRVVLRRKEFEVLRKLADRPGRAVPRHELLSDVFGYKEGVISRTLDTHIFELRRKLGHDPNEPGYIETVARVGYRLVTAAESRSSRRV